MRMKLKLLGVRGSRPTHKKGLLGFGGNSTAFELLFEHENFRIFIDGGTGLAHRSRELSNDTSISKYYFLITHTHWDHILGFPFFEPLYKKNNEIIFYASNTSQRTFNDIFFGLQRSANMPIPTSKIKAKISFNAIQPQIDFKIEEKVLVKTYQLNHQGVTLGYRITYDQDSVAIITDNAPIENGNVMGEGMIDLYKQNPEQFEQTFNHGLVKFLQGCDTAVIDTHFTEENLKADWGHSTPLRALNLCHQAGVKRLIIFHHAPEDLDEDVIAKINSIIDLALEYGVEVVAAKEGEEWELR